MNNRSSKEEKSPLLTSGLHKKVNTTKIEEQTAEKESDLIIHEKEFFEAFLDPNIEKIKKKIQSYLDLSKNNKVSFDDLPFKGEVKAETIGFAPPWEHLYLDTRQTLSVEGETKVNTDFVIIFNNNNFPPSLQKEIAKLQITLKKSDMQDLMGEEATINHEVQLSFGEEYTGIKINYDVICKPYGSDSSSEQAQPGWLDIRRKGTFLKYNLYVKGSLGDILLEEFFQKDFPVKDQYVVFEMMAPVTCSAIHYRKKLTHKKLQEAPDPDICLVM